MNIDLNQCVKTVVNIGSTTFVNICDSTEVTVTWGYGDWVVAAVLGSLVLTLAVMLVVLVTSILREGF